MNQHKNRAGVDTRYLRIVPGSILTGSGHETRPEPAAAARDES